MSACNSPLILELNIYMQISVGETVDATYVRVDKDLHVGYSLTSSKEWEVCGMRYVILRFIITGLRVSRPYEVIMEPQHIKR